VSETKSKEKAAPKTKEEKRAAWRTYYKRTRRSTWRGLAAGAQGRS